MVLWAPASAFSAPEWSSGRFETQVPFRAGAHLPVTGLSVLLGLLPVPPFLASPKVQPSPSETAKQTPTSLKTWFVNGCSLEQVLCSGPAATLQAGHRVEIALVTELALYYCRRFGHRQNRCGRVGLLAHCQAYHETKAGAKRPRNALLPARSNQAGHGSAIAITPEAGGWPHLVCEVPSRLPLWGRWLAPMAGLLNQLVVAADRLWADFHGRPARIDWALKL